MKKIRKGFTLIEMVIVLFIISLLLLIMIPNLVTQRDHASKRSEEAFKTTLVTQAGLYIENEQKNNDSQNEKGKVSIKDLKEKEYITESQYNRAKELKLNDDGNIFEEVNTPKANNGTV